MLELTKRSRVGAKKYRGLLAVVLILIVAGMVGYEYFLPFIQQQQLQQEAVTLVEQYNLYSPNYSYVLFGSLYLNGLLSGANTTGYTSTQAYVVETYINKTYTTENETETFAITIFQTSTEGDLAYNESEATLTYSIASVPTTLVYNTSSALVIYDIQYGVVSIIYENGPLCKSWAAGPVYWQTACKSSVLMLIDTQSTVQLPSALNPRYKVMTDYGPIYQEPLALVANWHFYFIYATYVAS
jgi:hypothetical protein